MSCTQNMIRPCALALGVAVALGLAGCGGGSNVRPSTSTPPPTMNASGGGGGSSFDNTGGGSDTGGDTGGNTGGDTGGDTGGGSEDGTQQPAPAIDAHLTSIHAGQAHAAGFTGKGVTIGFVDSGINRQHPALANRVVQSKNFVDCSANDCNKDDVLGHGTMVAEIAAGATFGRWPGGVAPGADLVSARIIADTEPKDDGTGNGNQVEASDAAPIANVLNPYLIQSGVQIMNNSWGGLYFDPDQTATVAAAFADAYRGFVIQHGGLVVFASGNSGKADPTDTASLPFWASDLEQGWLVAVALDTQDPTKLASYSNQCGRSKDYCITAPGNVEVPGPYKDFQGDSGWNIYSVQGTSFAAPEVSGAAALVWQAFPYFTNDLVRQTLLGTAKDLGDPGVDKVFGWGLLDVGKAVKGPARFAWGDVTADFDDITSTWSNDISGTGGLVKKGTGTLVLAGDDTYAGGTTISGGTLQIGNGGTTGSITGDVTDGGVLTFHRSDDVSFAGAISGSGSVVQAGPGIVTLTGANTYVGDTTVAGGTLRSTGELPGSVAVNAKGTLDAVPGVAFNLSNAGTVAVHGGDTTVGGNYTQSKTGTLTVSLGSKLDITGMATLAGTLKITGADQGYVDSAKTYVLHAGGGISGQFDTYAGSVFTSTSAKYDADGVWLDTVGLNVTTAAAGNGVQYTPASMGSAQRVQGAFETLDTKIADDSLSSVSSAFVDNAGAFQRSPNLRAAQASLESLSGQLHAASAGMTLQAIDATGRALSDRLERSRDQGDKSHMWTRQLQLGGAMTRSGFASVDYQLDGWLVGRDMRLGPQVLAGFAFSQGSGVEQLTGRFDRNRSRHTAGMAYAAWTDRDWYAHGRIGMGHYHQDMNRTLLLGLSYQGVWTDYNGHYNVAYAQTGRHFELGGMRLTPFADMEYDRVARHGFAEHGAGGFGLKADDQVLGRWQGGVGLKLGRQWRFPRGRSLRLDARAQWRRTLSASGMAFDASFVGLDAWRPLTGVGLSRRSAVFGLDLEARPSTRTHFTLGYEYLTGDRGRASVASAHFRLSF